MSVVLVTGAGGFIGRYVVQACRASGQDVLELQHRWSDRAQLDALLADQAIERCIHLGWHSNPADYLTNVAENLRSLNSSIELFESVRDHGCRHLVVTGSCAEYAQADAALAEDARVGPWSVYGAAKASLHLMLASSMGGDRPGLAWTRLFNLTGPGDDARRLVPATARRLLNRESMGLSPGGQVRDYLDVRDVASALVHLSTTASEGTFNICSGRGIALRDLLALLADACGAPRELLAFGERDYTIHDSMLTVGDPSLLHASGWQPFLDLTQTLADVVADVGATVGRSMS